MHSHSDRIVPTSRSLCVAIGTSAMAEGGLKRSAATAAEDAGTMDGKLRASSSSEVAPAKGDRVSDRDANAAAGALAKRALLRTDRLHQLLGPGWTAVLLEACCVRAKDQRAYLPAGGKEKLRLRSNDFAIKPPGTKGRFGVLETAAARGSKSFALWLRKNRARWSKNTCAFAAKGGHLHVIKYAHENGCPWDATTCSKAAEGGHLDVLKYAHENGCPWDKETCKGAAKGGHLNVIKYAHEKGCPMHTKTCEYAAEGGHLAVLKYAHAKGCSWDEKTCEVAAKGGHLAVLKYLHKNECPWDEKTCKVAAEGNHLAVLKYAHENGCPWDAYRIERMAAFRGLAEVLIYCHTEEKGHEPYSFMILCDAAKGGHLDLCKVSRSHRPRSISSCTRLTSHPQAHPWRRPYAWDKASGKKGFVYIPNLRCGSWWQP